ncbi:MAG TPA: aminodeoxychorismate/anthranilate synthase component II [Bacteroidota bacterium]
MILIIDNYDSFTYNLVQYLGELGAEQTVVRNDAISADEIASMRPTHIVISPGPCTPKEAGISVDVIRRYHQTIPILGVCLGHQAIGEAFGGRIVRAPAIVHGKTSEIIHKKEGVFKGIPSPFTATRYHSLVIEPESMPSELSLTAWTQDNVIMGVQHKTSHTYGVQFHPESIATKHGKDLLKNFLKVRM